MPPNSESRSHRHPIYAGKVLYNLRGGFLVRPLAITLILGSCGILLANLELLHPALGAWIPPIFALAHAGPQVAQTVLTCVAGSVMTVVSIVFAILLMTLTLASMQFSPRIIVSFTMDPVTQWTLGIFLGTFSYCVAALPAASAPTPVANHSTTVAGAMLLSLVCVAWLLFFIFHIAQAISVNHIVDRIAGETEAMIRATMPVRMDYGKTRITSGHPEAPGGVPILSATSGYVRHIDVKLLVKLAKEHRVAITVTRRVGHFVPAGVPFATVSKEHKMTAELAQGIRWAFDLGPTRTLQQDIEFGILQIVDIALKAISPAVNDPSTAISCVDHLGRILICFAGREPVESRFYDPPGVLRVTIPTLGLDRLVHSAFEQIRNYSKGDVAVNLRMLRALSDLALTVPDRNVRKMLVAVGSRIVSGADGALQAEEMSEMKARLETLRQLETTT